MLLGELCRRLGVPYRQARYVLEEDILPPGVDPAPDRGNHRQLSSEQAFWLGIVLKLKEAGMKTPLAATMASLTAGIFARVDLRKYDPEFEPFRGRLHARLNWYAELGDLRFIRLRAEREKPREALLDGTWFPIDGKKAKEQPSPVVRIQVDLSQIGRLLS
ncbi:MAG: MerR family transcriptional regulator [Planctomycetia bacterium]|nr:MerR family transcriptional regulator [Planctomycetia bacterium]